MTTYIEVECPKCWNDFDLDTVLPADSEWECPGCCTKHRLGDVGQLCQDGPGWQVHPQDDAWRAGLPITAA